VANVPSNATNVKVQYRIKNTTDWKDASDSGNGIWTIEPVWSEGTTNASGKMTYTVDNTTGVFAGNDYEYQLIYTAARRGNTPRKKKPPCNRREVGDKGLWPSGYSGGLVYPLEIFD
jgi:hypothetical protein